jgi:hypothetical protein
MKTFSDLSEVMGTIEISTKTFNSCVDINEVIINLHSFMRMREHFTI